jgi:hypothetical protein
VSSSSTRMAVVRGCDYESVRGERHPMGEFLCGRRQVDAAPIEPVSHPKFPQNSLLISLLRDSSPRIGLDGIFGNHKSTGASYSSPEEAS